MTLPALTSNGWLPPGLYRCSLSEVEDLFVTSAPHRPERATVWTAFTAWSDQIWSLWPEAILWIDGGFVTHKAWAAPTDVDVAVRVAPADWNARMTDEIFRQLFTWRTARWPAGTKVKPMSGLVDAFYCPRGDVGSTIYWRDKWSTVVDEAKAEIPGAVKGFAEVVST